MKLAKNFSIASVAVVISVAAVGLAPTQAAVVNYNFTVNATSGNNAGEYYGSFQYDDSSLTGTGEETLKVNNGLSVLFNYLGTQYTEASDIDYEAGLSPLVGFKDGKLLGLSYLVEDQFFIGNNPENSDMGGKKFYTIISAAFPSTTEVGTVSYSKVPEPLTLGGTAIAGAMGLWIKRKKKLSQVN
ncbi:PEP-CTERM sorting domain-containing protein [aff. Roholtiella sp. LEGE 12411]|uniref:PEP-CTERM sorting domain-containing protein n=1 Tax=aff. Roholtiella sp. LEGE 12411 TaxID=1828822 RepID=UPI0018806ACC|nr:PEP-CTERM sorting domain-containing protein [aff. Roholtiella sp. LEGE 12411]MBE9038258.1 PEP-CTERM sorting domain-containing protein [aff. Roholtiella sp. LEGE 12411]